MRKIVSSMTKAIKKFNMINNGDKVAVGLSGGKDSLILLSALSAFQKFEGENFELIAITIDQSGGKLDFSGLQKFCDDLQVPLYIEKTDIFEVVFDERKEKNPCSLCAKMRRGTLNSKAKSLGCNKVALAHHCDDLMETFFLSLFYEGRLSTFSPVTYLSNVDITAIRPLVYVSEEGIIDATKNFPILKNPCPANHKTKREEIKNLLKKLDKEFPNAKKQIKNAILNPERNNLINF